MKIFKKKVTEKTPKSQKLVDDTKEMLQVNAYVPGKYLVKCIKCD